MNYENAKKTLVTRTNTMRTICEVHREIYDIVEDHLKDTPYYHDLVAKLQEAYIMAKKMNTKLIQYKNNYDDGWWEKESAEVYKEKLKKRAIRE